MIPQLAHVAKDLDSYILSPDWALEEKFDGDRLLIHFIDSDTVRAYSRQGNEVVVPRIKTARSVLEFKPLPKNNGVTILDGEVMPDGTFHLFDIPLLLGQEIKNLPYSKRRDILTKTFSAIRQPGFVLVESITDPKLKRQKAVEIHAAGGEGVMFKSLTSTYRFDHRSNEWLKWKFYKTASVIIMEMQREGKDEAVTIGVFKDGNIQEISGCKIPWRYQQEFGITAGDVIEVRYLNFTKDDKLIQPVFLKKRNDVNSKECTIETLTQTEKQ